MFNFYKAKKNILKKIEYLEKSVGTNDFERLFLNFFNLACRYLRVNKATRKAILNEYNPLIVDSIIWKYLNDFDLNYQMREYKCFKMPKEDLDRIHSQHIVLVEPLLSFSEINFLPKNEVIVPSSAYIFIDNKPYLLTLIEDLRSFRMQGDDNFHSEQKWAEKETAIFISLMNLCSERFFTFYTSYNSFYIPVEDISFLDENTIKSLHDKIKLYEFVENRKKDDGSNIGNTNFIYKDNINPEEINRINLLIDRDNQILIRCLYYFAKACSFVGHKMTIEESTALQMFCLDGLSKLFMKKYNLNTFNELVNLLKNELSFSCADYLRELYDERTIYVHPANDFGEFWCPPWDTDTCLDTLPMVRDMLNLYLKKEDNNNEPEAIIDVES